jgi:cell division septation protein DedD
MAATTRRARNYKEKSSGFTFGHFALPVAAVIALGLLLVGIKLFFLSPPEQAKIQVSRTTDSVTSHTSFTPVTQESDFTLEDAGRLGGEFAATEPENAANASSRVSNVSQPTRPSARVTDSSKSRWGVQIGAFVNEGSASTLVSEAKKQGYPAFISRVASSGKTFHRVRVGAGNKREDADRLASELEQKGYPVSVVPML